MTMRPARLAQNAMLPLATLLLIMLMVVPIPAAMLDVGFVLNIALSLAVLLVALNVQRPLDFSAFPTVLLFATLLRLALNVASTRVVLLHGHDGPGAAGHVIEAFGQFLIGGDYAVGIFVFLILMIINLIVITKGAGRVSEVSARFILDALPGKQMAIDADLGAGLMTPDEARARRQEVGVEADFYGSMDGASKFVKGDAVAGVLILVVNIVGGFVLGMVSHGLSAGEAASAYVVLAIGDALVAQVPALLLSIAAAAIVTRVTSPHDLGEEIGKQFATARAWTPVALILALLALLPGMPHLLLGTVAVGAGALAWKLSRPRPQPVVSPVEERAPGQIEWSDIADDAAIALDLGIALVGLVDERRGAPLMQRITGIRKNLSRELGFVIPRVRVRDELTLSPTRYRIAIAGAVVGEHEVFPDDLLAIDTGAAAAAIPDARATTDPAFGLPAYWIAAEARAQAEVAGYTVVDAVTVIATHLNRMVELNADALFGVDDAQAMLDALKVDAPQLAQSLVPGAMTSAQLAVQARALLADGVTLKQSRAIAEALVEAARPDSDPQQWVDGVRERIAPIIVQGLSAHGQTLGVMTLHPELETLASQAVRAAPHSSHPIEPALGQRIVRAVAQAAAERVARGERVALVVSPALRRPLARLLAPSCPDVVALSFLEIPDGKPVELFAVIGEPAEAAPALAEAA